MQQSQGKRHLAKETDSKCHCSQQRNREGVKNYMCDPRNKIYQAGIGSNFRARPYQLERQNQWRKYH